MATTSLKITYQKAHDYKTSFVSGVHGGITANGLITASFFTDGAALPDLSFVTVDEKNNVISIDDKKDSDSIREAQFGVLMDINTTKVIIEWLSSRVNEIELLIKKDNDNL